MYQVKNRGGTETWCSVPPLFSIHDTYNTTLIYAGKSLDIC